MVATELDFERFALDHPERKWEHHRGQLREKPPMVSGHRRAQRKLTYQLIHQLDEEEFFVVVVDAGHVARRTSSYYIPDLFVVPADQLATVERQPRVFEVFRDPLPLIVEVWSPSTGAYDIDEKIPEYLARGDLEIWRLHPFARTLKAWRRREDGGYDEVEFSGGPVELHALPGVTVNLDALFVAEE
jgi:Uma2 family endonuclease